MWERSKTSRVSWPEIVVATFSETPRSNQVANRRPPQVMDDKTSVPLVVGSFNVSQPFEPHGDARSLPCLAEIRVFEYAAGSAPCGTRRHPPRFALVTCQRIQRIEAVDLAAVCVQNPGEFFL